MDVCDACGKKNLTSHYRCQNCGQWVGGGCWDAGMKMCAPCAGLHAEALAEAEADLYRV